MSTGNHTAIKLKKRKAVEEIAEKLELTADSVNEYIAAHPVTNQIITRPPT